VTSASSCSSEGTAAPRRMLGYVCFAICAAAVVYGIYLAIPNLHKLF
jgi:hypothetical protein